MNDFSFVYYTSLVIACFAGMLLGYGLHSLIGCDDGKGAAGAAYDAVDSVERVDDETAYRLLRDAGLLKEKK
jgi:hypothetical protein